MKMILHKTLPFTFFGFILAITFGCTTISLAQKKNHTAMIQVSTYPALQMGMFNGDVTYAQLKEAGDFGLGTFNNIDGEMVALDGKFYQAKTDGSVNLADTTWKTPFATVHFFKSDRQVILKDSIQGYDQLRTYLTRQFPTDNNPAAFKIAGTFSYLKLRSVPKQSEPFPTLAEVVAKQTTFEFRNIKGTLVGYRVPEYLAAINWPGYHLHFISDDRQHAGHMLECSLIEAIIAMDEFDSVTFLIPQTANFQKKDFSKTQK